MTISRRNRRGTISRSEAFKQQKVVARAEKMVDYFKSLGLEKLKDIENEKRSKTDTFAYHAALYELNNPPKSDTIEAVAY